MQDNSNSFQQNPQDKKMRGGRTVTIVIAIVLVVFYVLTFLISGYTYNGPTIFPKKCTTAAQCSENLYCKISWKPENIEEVIATKRVEGVFDNSITVLKKGASGTCKNFYSGERCYLAERNYDQARFGNETRDTVECVFYDFYSPCRSGSSLACIVSTMNMIWWLILFIFIILSIFYIIRYIVKYLSLKKINLSSDKVSEERILLRSYKKRVFISIISAVIIYLCLRFLEYYT